MLAYFKPHIHQFAGVTVMNGKHTVRILSDNRFFLVGTYDTPEEASLAYERAIAKERTRLSRNNADNKKTKDVSNPPALPVGGVIDTKVAAAGAAAAACKKRKHRSYIGVFEKGAKFVAQIHTNNEKKELGIYDTPEEAARAFDLAVLERKFPVSLLNYPACTAKKKALTVASSVKAQESKFVKHQQAVAHYDGKWLPVTIVDVLTNKYYNVHWTGYNETTSVHEDELNDTAPLVDQSPAAVASSDKAVAALSDLAIVTQQSKPKKKTKKTVTAKKRGPRTKNVNGSTDDEKRKSFAEWYKECVTVGNQRSGQPIFKAKVVYQHYQQWCVQRNKPWMSPKGTLNFKVEMNKTGTPWYKHAGSRYYHPIASIKGYESKKKPKKTKTVPEFPFGIPAPLVKSFNDFFEETCRVDFTNSKPSDSGLLMVGDVHKEYRAWCTRNKRTYCPERTSKEWGRAPFVVNNIRIDRLPPFRLLMFAKLDRLPRRVKDVFSSTETAWRRHKKSYVGHPYYKGLQWKDSFTPTLKYVHGKKKTLSAVDMFDSITRGW